MELWEQASGRQETLGTYTAKTFGWMFLGLAITFAVSLVLLFSGASAWIIKNTATVFAVLALELILVIVLSAKIRKLSAGAARILFLAYAVVNGISLPMIMIHYDAGSAVILFGVTMVIFGIMALVGYTTKTDLSSWRKVLLFGILGLALFWFVSIFVRMTMLEMIISFLGVALFLGCTAYDTQKIKQFYYGYQGDEALMQKAAIISALQLYLDFINLFIYLLRILGKRN